MRAVLIQGSIITSKQSADEGRGVVGSISHYTSAAVLHESPSSLQWCVDQNKSPPEQTSAPDGNSSHVNAVVDSRGPAAKHLKQAQPRRALHAGTQCAAGAHLG